MSAIPPNVSLSTARGAAYWERVLPRDVAVRQAKWETAKAIERARDTGASFREIARSLHTSPENVRRLLKHGQSAAPIEAMLNAPPLQ